MLMNLKLILIMEILLSQDLISVQFYHVSGGMNLNDNFQK